MGPYGVLALVAAIALLVLLPTRRLFLAGWPASFLATYFLVLTGLGFLVAEIRGPARFLVPILVVLYIAPFVTARAGVARFLGGRGGGPGRPGGAPTVVRTVARPTIAPPRRAAPPPASPPPPASADDSPPAPDAPAPNPR